MKKFIILFLSSCLIFSLVGCGKTDKVDEDTTAIVEESQIEQEKNEYKPSDEKVHTVRINGIDYYETNRKISTIEEVTEDTITGDIRSFVGRDEFPNEDNQSNFGVGYTYQVKDKDFAYVNISNEWHIFCSNDDGENIVTFHDRVFLKTELSSDTLKWLENYNSLSEEEQMATSSIPADLIDEVIMEVEDVEDMPVDEENEEDLSTLEENTDENEE